MDFSARAASARKPGVIGIIYGGAMMFGGQDVINNTFDGDWNLQLNKSINSVYKK